VDVLVIGGGPTGLGAATRLHERGADWLLLEAADRPGGMATSVVDDDGFRWDLGGHVLQSHSADFDRAVADSGVRMLSAIRNAWVWLDGELVPAPIQHQVDELPTLSSPYPEGGTGALWGAIAARLDPDDLRMRATVCGIDLDRHTARLADGGEIRFVDCVSSMPLTTLMRSVGRPEWAARSSSLIANATLVVGLGYTGTPPEALADTSWLYCSDKSVAWQRATMLSNFDPGNAGDGRWSVLCEVGRSAYGVVDRATAVTSCRDEMAKLGADPTTLHSTWVRDVPSGCPVPTPGRDDLLRELDAGLIRCGVRSRGRLGGWRSESGNQDYAFQQGVEAVEAIMTGSREDVYWRPERS
jgi:protoporphyrinogen oxidase